jgi:hypothetical protein
MLGHGDGDAFAVHTHIEGRPEGSDGADSGGHLKGPLAVTLYLKKGLPAVQRDTPPLRGKIDG